MIRRVAAVVVALTGLIVFAGVTWAQEWKPTKPVRIIVPWGAGGSTDLAVRALVPDLEEGLGQRVVVVNQPGGAGAIGTRAVMDAPNDGYTWASGAVAGLGTYVITGMLNTRIQDWHVYLNIANIGVIAVHPDAPIKDFGEFLEMMRKDPKRLTVAVAGVPSSGHAAIEAVKRAGGGDYRLVSYDGGAPAVIATVGGETMATSQLLSEQIEMIRAKRLRPLAALSAKDLVVEGFGTIPSALKWLPKMAVDPVYFGIWIPRGAPKEVVNTMNRIWRERIAKSKTLADFARLRGMVVTPYYGEAAFKAAWTPIVNQAWGLFDGNRAKVNPADVGMPRP